MGKSVLPGTIKPWYRSEKFIAFYLFSSEWTRERYAVKRTCWVAVIRARLCKIIYVRVIQGTVIRRQGLHAGTYRDIHQVLPIKVCGAIFNHYHHKFNVT